MTTLAVAHYDDRGVEDPRLCSTSTLLYTTSSLGGSTSDLDLVTAGGAGDTMSRSLTTTTQHHQHSRYASHDMTTGYHSNSTDTGHGAVSWQHKYSQLQYQVTMATNSSHSHSHMSATASSSSSNTATANHR